MTKDEIIIRGKNAKQLLDQPFFKETVEALKRDAFDQLCLTNPSMVEEREKLHDIMYNWQHCLAQLNRWHEQAVFEANSAEIARNQ